MIPFLIGMLVFETAALAALAFLFYRRSKKARSLASDVDAARATGKEAERAAAGEKNRLVATLESMAEGVVVTDTRGRVILANSILERMLALRRDHANGRYYWEIFRDPQINSMIEKSLKERALVKGEDSLLLTNFKFEIQVSPVFRGKDFLGAVAVFHDVTKLKELERMRTEFVANVSHELKTPLTSILGFVETLKEGGVDDAVNRMKFLDIIDEHAKKLMHLIEELLLLSKLESGAEPLKKETLDLEKTVANVLKFFDAPVKSARLTVKQAIAPRPFLFSADPKTFEQALSNLLDNAVKYNRPGGEILIEASENTEGVRVAVKDTGIGIPATDLSRIFERFYRVDKSRARDSGGTGLGLSIVKHIVERHGGRVAVWSTVNQGTVFEITLPKNP